MFVEFSTI